VEYDVGIACPSLSMSLFLSKLFPLLFVYPLGVASILLVVSLFMMWRRSHWAAVPVGLSLALIWLASNVWVTNGMLQSLEWRYIPQGELPKAEAIVLLGGATRSVAYPRVNPDLQEHGDRVTYAAQLFREGKAPLIIASGGRVDWIDSGTAESTDMAGMLHKDFGVPKAAILEDPASANTYENAINVQKIMAEHKIQKVLLVTSAFHMPRSVRIFRKLKMDVIPAPSDYLVSKLELEEPFRSPQAFLLGIIPNTEKLDKFTVALKEYVGLWTYILKGWA
jgi:uncharacterized SAM-binding protein YcdF (DUF218 family)